MNISDIGSLPGAAVFSIRFRHSDHCRAIRRCVCAARQRLQLLVRRRVGDHSVFDAGAQPDAIPFTVQLVYP